MSWLFSQALVEEYSGESSSGGEPSAPLNGNPIPQAFCAPDKMTAFSRLFRFGMTFKPLTADLGEALLMSYLAAFPARTSPQLGGGLESTESEAECGNIWRGWLAKYDPDTSSWRTAQCSLLEDSTECLETFPRSGMTRGGLLWELAMLELLTEETDFGWWPTPVATDWMGGKVNGIEHRNKRFVRTSLTSGVEFGAKLTDAFRLMTGGALPPSFSEHLMMWPLGWTDLKPLEMDKSHSVPQQLGDC